MVGKHVLCSSTYNQDRTRRLWEKESYNCKYASLIFRTFVLPGDLQGTYDSNKSTDLMIIDIQIHVMHCHIPGVAKYFISTTSHPRIVLGYTGLHRFGLLHRATVFSSFLLGLFVIQYVVRTYSSELNCKPVMIFLNDDPAKSSTERLIVMACVQDLMIVEGFSVGTLVTGDPGRSRDTNSQSS